LVQKLNEIHLKNKTSTVQITAEQTEVLLLKEFEELYLDAEKNVGNEEIQEFKKEIEEHFESAREDILLKGLKMLIEFTTRCCLWNQASRVN
jgi:hypothetical protein